MNIFKFKNFVLNNSTNLILLPRLFEYQSYERRKRKKEMARQIERILCFRNNALNIVEKGEGQKGKSGAHRAIASSSIRFFSVVSLQFFSPIPTIVLHTRSHTRSAQRKQVNADAHAHPASLDPGLASRHDSDKHLSIPFLYLFYLSRPPSISISATMTTSSKDFTKSLVFA